MPNFEVQHYRKIKTAVGLRNVAAHNMRHAIYGEDGKELQNEQLRGEWYRPENAIWNDYDELESPEPILKRRNDRIKEAKLPRKPQKNAAFAIEGVLSASHEWGADWEKARKSRKEWEKYLAEARKWAEKRFGKENILHCAVHFDEFTPHLHVLMVPIYKKDKENRYSSSEFLGGRAGMRSHHNHFHTEVGAKYGLERGREESRASHTTIKQVHQDKLNLAKRQYLLDVEETKEFAPKLPKRPLVPFFWSFQPSDPNYTGKPIHYDKFAKLETEYQANTWAFQKRLKRAEELKWVKGEHARLNQFVDEVNKYRMASPDELRKMADDRERAYKEELQRRREEQLKQERERQDAIERNKGRDNGGRGR